jgi:hypothetical protein
MRGTLKTDDSRQLSMLKDLRSSHKWILRVSPILTTCNPHHPTTLAPPSLMQSWFRQLDSPVGACHCLIKVSPKTTWPCRVRKSSENSLNPKQPQNNSTMAWALHNFKNSQIQGYIPMISHSPLSNGWVFNGKCWASGPLFHYTSGFLTILLGPLPPNLEIPTRTSNVSHFASKTYWDKCKNIVTWSSSH